MVLFEIKQLTKRKGNATLFSPVDLHIDRAQCVVVNAAVNWGILVR